MAKINYQIQEGNFSIVNTRIAEILLLEFANQKANYSADFLPDKVYIDPFYSVDEGNIPFVSCNWINFESSEDGRAISTNLNEFFIDVKAIGYENFNKIIAIIRTILKSEQYIKLDFDYGIVSDTNIVSAGVNFEESLRDSQGVISGGLRFQCKITENNDKPVPQPLNESEYNSEVDESGKFLTLKSIYT